MWFKELNGIGDTAQNLLHARRGRELRVDGYVRGLRQDRRRGGLPGARRPLPPRGRHRKAPRGALPCPFAQCGDCRGVQKERGQASGSAATAATSSSAPPPRKSAPPAPIRRATSRSTPRTTEPHKKTARTAPKPPALFHARSLRAPSARFTSRSRRRMPRYCPSQTSA